MSRAKTPKPKTDAQIVDDALRFLERLNVSLRDRPELLEIIGDMRGLLSRMMGAQMKPDPDLLAEKGEM